MNSTSAWKIPRIFLIVIIGGLVFCIYKIKKQTKAQIEAYNNLESQVIDNQIRATVSLENPLIGFDQDAPPLYTELEEGGLFRKNEQESEQRPTGSTLNPEPEVPEIPEVSERPVELIRVITEIKRQNENKVLFDRNETDSISLPNNQTNRHNDQKLNEAVNLESKFTSSNNLENPASQNATDIGSADDRINDLLEEIQDTLSEFTNNLQNSKSSNFIDRIEDHIETSQPPAYSENDEIQKHVIPSDTALVDSELNVLKAEAEKLDPNELEENSSSKTLVGDEDSSNNNAVKKLDLDELEENSSSKTLVGDEDSSNKNEAENEDSKLIDDFSTSAFSLPIEDSSDMLDSSPINN